MGNVSSTDYIRWVKGSLNRLLGTTLTDNDVITPDYRAWIVAFQINQKLMLNVQVDIPTQNALIKRNKNDDTYVHWIQNALLISGEGVGTGGSAIAPDGRWGPNTEAAVKDFQINSL